MLLAAPGWRTNLTHLQLGYLFTISDSAVCRAMADLGPGFEAVLGPPAGDKREVWLVGGTLVTVGDRRATAKCKNYRRSVNARVPCRYRDGKVVFAAMPGPVTATMLGL